MTTRGSDADGRARRDGADRRFTCVVVAITASVLALLFVLCTAGLLHIASFESEERSSDVEPSAERIAAREEEWARWTARRESVPVRDVTLRVVGDQRFREAAGVRWRENVESRVQRASRVFEREFRIRFVVASIDEWTSEGGPSIHPMHRALARSMVSDSADVVLGFAGDFPECDNRGVSYYYGRCCIVMVGPPNAPWPYEDETLLHELAHLFGAWHARDAGSVMREWKTGAPTSSLDVYARTAILAARGVDFRRGLEALPDGVVDAAAAAWKERHPGGVGFPPFEACCTEAWCRRDDGRLDRAASLCAKALAIDRRLGPFPRRPDDADVLAWAASSGSRQPK